MTVAAVVVRQQQNLCILERRVVAEQGNDWWASLLSPDGLEINDAAPHDPERYRLAAGRLIQACDTSDDWTKVLGAWEILRRLEATDDGVVEIDDDAAADGLSITPETWRRWLRLLGQAGLVKPAENGLFVNLLPRAQPSRQSTEPVRPPGRTSPRAQR